MPRKTVLGDRLTLAERAFVRATLAARLAALASSCSIHSERVRSDLIVPIDRGASGASGASFRRARTAKASPSASAPARRDSSRVVSPAPPTAGPAWYGPRLLWGSSRGILCRRRRRRARERPSAPCRPRIAPVKRGVATAKDATCHGAETGPALRGKKCTAWNPSHGHEPADRVIDVTSINGCEPGRICDVYWVVEDVGVAVEALAPEGRLHDWIGRREAPR